MRTIALAAGIAMVLVSRAAEAQVAVPVTWNAPEGCPERAAVVTEIERLLGEVDWAKWDSLDAVLEATPAETGWTVTVTTAEPAGERVIRGASCHEVAAAAALIVAMTIDPDFVPPEPAKAPPFPDPPPEGEGDGEAEPPPSSPRTPVRWAVGGNVTGELGALPGIGPGVGLTAAGLWDVWRFEVSGTYWFERREELADPDGVGGDLSMWLAAARVCRAAFTNIDVCLGFEAGRVRGEGFGIAEPKSNSSTWLAPVAGLAYSSNISKSLSIRVSGDIASPLTRPRFNVAPNMQTVEVHQPAPVTGRLLVGAEVRIP